LHLIAIGYPDPITAPLAMDELKRSGGDLSIRWDEVAVTVREEEGIIRTFTNAVITSGQPSWPMFWWSFFATLFFVPSLGMGIGPGLATILDEVRRSALDPAFEESVRKELAPGTSALFVVVSRMSPDTVASALERFGGEVLQHRISKEGEALLTKALSGRPLVG
jgi:uncharacterized membrane protein